MSDELGFSTNDSSELVLDHIEFDLLGVASRSLTIFAPLARGKGLLLHSELSDTTTWLIMGDPTRLGQVLNHLLSNAIKFTERGQVTLRVQEDTATSCIVIEVQDSGIGMSEELALRIFQPFSQTNNPSSCNYGGTGLGLMWCQRLSAAMGGKLSVVSQSRQGCLFRLSIPIEVSKPAERPLFGGESVLLVAAMTEQRAYLEQVLQKWGLCVTSYQHPTQLDEQTLANPYTLILWGDRITWCAEDENRLVERSLWVIDCAGDGPYEPKKAGKVLSASIHGVAGLAYALLYVFYAQPFPREVVEGLKSNKYLRVLVADTDLVSRRLITGQLKLLGCHVSVVDDDEQAVVQLQQHTFDLLITELSMPRLDGCGLVCLAREKRLCILGVAAATSLMQQEYENYKAIGVVNVLIKPFSLASLASAINELCGGVVQTNESLTKPNPDRLVFSPQTNKSSRLSDMSLPAEVHDAFIQACSKSCESLKKGMSNNDTATILNELHSLRGAFGVFGMPQLAQHAAGLDEQVRRQGCLLTATAIETFCNTLDNTVLRSSNLCKD